MQQDQDELRNSVVSILRDDLLNEFKTTLRNELKETIRSEIKTVLRAELDERLAQIESRLAQLATLHTKLQDMEDALNFHCKMVDDIRNTDLPALASHLEKVASGLALQTLNLDVHSRKWSLTIQGIKGEADEDEATTRQACADLARSHLKITDATGDNFSACHRLNRKKDAGIIIRFKDLSRRNRRLDEAKNLRTHPDKISISPDLPPVIRPLKSELLQMWQSSRPASFSPAGLTLWPSWLERWLATLSGLSVQVRNQWGCRDVTLGARPQAWVKLSALIVHSEPTDCHVSLWPGENGGLSDRGVWCHWGREECDNPAC